MQRSLHAPAARHTPWAAERTRDVLLTRGGGFGAQTSTPGVTRDFAFHSAMDEHVTQPEVFERSGAKRLLDWALRGYSSTIFAYGQTGAGKTYTTMAPPASTSRAGRERSDSRAVRQPPPRLRPHSSSLILAGACPRYSEQLSTAF